MEAARRSSSAGPVPQQTTWATEKRSEPGSRPSLSQARRTRSYWASVSATLQNGTLVSVAKRAARRGVTLAPRPPTITGGRGDCTGLGRAGLSATW